MIVYVSSELDVSKICLGNDFHVKIMNWERIMINSCFDANPRFYSFGYFFVPGQLGHLKFVSEEVFRSTDSIDNISINICRESKNEIFLREILLKLAKILKSFFFDSLCLQRTRRVEKLPWE